MGIDLSPRTSAAIHSLREAGVALGPDVVEWALTEARGATRATEGRTPLVWLLTSFSRWEWLAVFREGLLRERLAWLLCSVAERKARPHPDSPTANEHICLCIRRDLAMCYAEGDEPTVEELYHDAAATNMLPMPAALPGGRTVLVDPETVKTWYRDIVAVRTGRRLRCDGGGSIQSCEREENPDEVVADPVELRRASVLGAAANRFSASDPLRPVVTFLIREADACRKAGQCERDLAGYYAISLLSIYYNMGWKDVLNLGLEPRDDGPGYLRPGWREIVRTIGNGYFNNDECFLRSDLRLPLLPIVRWMLAKAGVNEEDGGTLAEALPPQSALLFPAWLKDVRKVVLPGVKLRSQALYRTFNFVATIRLKMPIPYLSILCGKPIFGSRGESSYTFRHSGEALGDWKRIYVEIQAIAGVGCEAVDLPVDGAVHGASEVCLQSMAAEMLRRVMAAATHNEIVSCIWGVLYLLGARRAALHRNPASLFRSEPRPCFLFSDKSAADAPRGLRTIPLNEPLLELVRVCRDLFGDEAALPYLQDGKWTSSLGLCDKAAYGIISQEPCQQPGRNALINALLREGMGSEPRGALTGHDSQTGLPSLFSIVSSDVLLDIAAEGLHRVLEHSGFNRLVEVLVSQLRRLAVPGCSDLGIAESDLDRFSSHGELFPKAGNAHLAPLTIDEDRLLGLLRPRLAGLAKEKPTTIRCQLLLAFQAGVPMENLRRYSGIYTWHNLIHSLAAGRYYFIAFGPHEDVGGLSPCPLDIGTPGESPALRMLLARFQALGKSYKTRTTAERLRWALFPEKDGELPKELRRILPEAEELNDAELMRLLDRLTLVNARRMHPGCVAGALAGRLPIGLNGYHIGDVIRERIGYEPVLRFLDGSPYREWLRIDQAYGDGKQITPYRAFCEAKKRIQSWWRNPTRTTKVETAEDLFVVLRRFNVSPSFSRFQNIALLLGISKDNARRFATSLLARFRRENLLQTSASLRLLPAPLLAERLARLEATELVLKPKEDARSRKGIRDDTTAALQLMRRAGLRLGETITTLHDGKRFHAATRVGYVTQGKTDNARRMFDPAILSGSDSGALLDQMDHAQGLLLPKDADRIQRLLADAFGNALSPHDLRHYAIIDGLRLCIREHLAHGNFQLALDTMSAMCGHACGITSVNSYAGNTVPLFFPLPRPTEVELTPQWWHDPSAVSPTALHAIRDEYSGLAKQRRAHRRLFRDFRRKCPFGPPAANESLGCDPVRAARPIFQCEIPTGPDQDLTADFVKDVLQLGRERNVDLRIGMRRALGATLHSMLMEECFGPTNSQGCKKAVFYRLKHFNGKELSMETDVTHLRKPEPLTLPLHFY